MKTSVMISAPIHSVPPRTGAAVEWWMYQVSKRLKSYRPHIIAIANDGDLVNEVSEGVQFHRIQIGRAYKRIFQKITRLDPWSYAHRANRIIERVGADLVHVHNTPSLYWQLVQLNRNPGRKYVLHMHNEKPLPRITPPLNLFVVSSYLQGYYKQKLPLIDGRVITNGVDMNAFKPKWLLDGIPSYPRLDNALPTNKKIIAYIGRMSPEKGPLKLVLAFMELAKHRTDVFLLLVGEFSKGENDRAYYGKSILEKCGLLADSCHVMDAIPPEQMHNVYYRTDLVVIPSAFQDPFPMVPIEAMATGTPVVATKRGGIPELISEPERGIFIKNVDDAVLFAKQLDELIDSPSLLDRVRINARHYVEGRHDWYNVGDQTEAAYEEITNA